MEGGWRARRVDIALPNDGRGAAPTGGVCPARGGETTLPLESSLQEQRCSNAQEEAGCRRDNSALAEPSLGVVQRLTLGKPGVEQRTEPYSQGVQSEEGCSPTLGESGLRAGHSFIHQKAWFDERGRHSPALEIPSARVRDSVVLRDFSLLGET